MRAFALLLLLAGVAHGEFVISEPVVASSCPAGKTWPDVVQCLGTFGKVRILESSPTVRLVRVITNDPNPVDRGIYLYLLDGPLMWKLGGMFEGEVEVVELAPITIAKLSGYRMTLARSFVTTVQVDEGVIAATEQQQFYLYCSGIGYRCVEAMTACDVLVRGKAIQTFRGAVKIDEDGSQFTIEGDRSKARACAPPERNALFWTNR